MLLIRKMGKKIDRSWSTSLKKWPQISTGNVLQPGLRKEFIVLIPYLYKADLDYAF